MTPYENLKEDIILGRLKPGSLFNEKEYALKLNISRTPVREAVLKLADEGYIQIIPRKGTLISSISFEDIKSIYEYRLILEPNIINLLKDKSINDDFVNKWIKIFESKKNESNINIENSINQDEDKLFHLGLAEFTNNSYIVNQVNQVMDKCLRIRILSNIESKNRYLNSLDEHLNILYSLKNKDYRKASEYMKKHLKNTISGFSFLGD